MTRILTVIYLMSLGGWILSDSYYLLIALLILVAIEARVWCTAPADTADSL